MNEFIIMKTENGIGDHEIIQLTARKFAGGEVEISLESHMAR
jgi:hypothetical protein